MQKAKTMEIRKAELAGTVSCGWCTQNSCASLSVQRTCRTQGVATSMTVVIAYAKQFVEQVEKDVV